MKVGYWPTFLLIRPMDKVKNTIKSLIPSDCTIINYNDFSKSGKIKLIIDSFDGIDLNSTSILAQKIKKSDTINEFYPNGLQLEISSPGIDSDLKLPFQFSKNIGRKLKISTFNEQELVITLTDSSDDGINGEDKNGKQINLTYDQIQNAKVIIEF
tara:strand:- start:198 stop:665 length:468 start_codon:yes stop_codon:yes gene_type:complete